MKNRAIYLIALFFVCLSFGLYNSYIIKKNAIRVLEHKSTLPVLTRLKLLVDEDEADNLKVLMEEGKENVYLNNSESNLLLAKEEALVFLKKGLTEIIQNDDNVYLVSIHSLGVEDQEYSDLIVSKELIKENPQMLLYSFREIIEWLKTECKQKSPGDPRFCKISENF